MPFDIFTQLRDLLPQLSKDQLLCLLRDIRELLQEIEEEDILIES